MTILQRRFIFYLFTGFFFISAPLILLLASGYSLNFQSGTLVRSGIILLEVSPADATVSINGIPDEASSRSGGVIRISPLDAGTYTVKLEKEGFLPWTHSLSVTAGRVTAPPPVALIRNTQSFVILPFASTLLAESPDHQLSLLEVHSTTATAGLVLLDQSRGAMSSLPALPPTSGLETTSLDALWSPDSQSILMSTLHGTTRRAVIYNVSSGRYTPPFNTSSNAHWTGDSQLIVNTQTTTIERIPVSDPLLSTSLSSIPGIVDADLSPFAPGSLLALEKEGQGLSMIRTPTQESAQPLLAALPLETRFVHSLFPYLLLRTNTLTLVVQTQTTPWSILAEIPSSDGMVSNAQDVLGLDHGHWYRVVASKPTVVLTAGLLEGASPSTFVLVPNSPWVALVYPTEVVLHSKPLEAPGVSAGWIPEPEVLPLEHGITVSGITTDPSGRRLYLWAERGKEHGVFVRLLSQE